MKDRAILNASEVKIVECLGRQLAQGGEVPTIMDFIREVGWVHVVCSLRYIYHLRRVGMVRKMSLIPEKIKESYVAELIPA